MTIAVDSSSHTLSVRPVGPVEVPVKITIPIFGDIRVPFRLAPLLTVLSIPMEAVSFQIETPHGQRTLVPVSRNHQLSRHDGYIEIKADAHFR